jgi:hypothetical protein
MKTCKKCQQPIQSRCYSCEYKRKQELLAADSTKATKDKLVRDISNEKRRQFRSSPQGKSAMKEENASRALNKKQWYDEKKNSDPNFLEKRRTYKRNRQQTEHGKKMARDYVARRIKEDPMFALKNRLRCRINSCLRKKSWSKNSKTIKIIGAEWETVKAYLESLFLDDMSWDNRGDWHIDHVIPLASAQNEEELEKLCHYTNLQPLWAIDNLKKGDSMPFDQET